MVEALEERRLLTTLVAYPTNNSDHVSEDGAASMTFLVYRMGEGGDQPVSFDFVLSGAASAADLTLSADGLDAGAGTLAFAAGQQQTTLTVAAAQDALVEPDEDFRIDFYDPADHSAPVGSLAGTVWSDDAEVWIDGGGLMSEQGGVVEFTVHRENASPSALHQPFSIYVRLKTAGEGTDRATTADYYLPDTMWGSNYDDGTSIWTAVSFAPDQDAVTFHVAAIDDNDVEPTEWLKVVVLGEESDPSGPAGGLPTQAFAGIVDDDAARPQPYHVWVSGPTDPLPEGGQTTYTIYRQRDNPTYTQPYAMDVAVDVAGFNAWVGGQFEVGGTAHVWTGDGWRDVVHFDVGQDQADITVRSIANDTPDAARSVTLTLADGSSYDPSTGVWGGAYTTPGDLAHPAAVSVALADDDHIAQPTGVTATPFSATRIDVSWQDQSPDEPRFIVQLSTDGGQTWSDAATTPPNATSATVEGVDANTTYEVRVVAPNPDGSLPVPPTDPPTKTRTPIADPAVGGTAAWSGAIHADNSDPPTDLPVLIDGVTYRLTARWAVGLEDGQAQDSVPGTGGDAEYGWGGPDYSGPEDVFDGADVGLRLTGVGESDPFWGPYNDDHVYTIDVAGTGQQLGATYQGWVDYPDPGAIMLDVTQLSPSVWVTVGTAQTTEHDDAAPDPDIPATFVVHRSSTYGGDLTVAYHFEGTADASDFTAPFAGQITFTGDQTEVEIPIFAVNDTQKEWTESLYLVPDRQAGYTLADADVPGIDIYDNEFNDLDILVNGIVLPPAGGAGPEVAHLYDEDGDAYLEIELHDAQGNPTEIPVEPGTDGITLFVTPTDMTLYQGQHERVDFILTRNGLPIPRESLNLQQAPISKAKARPEDDAPKTDDRGTVWTYIQAVKPTSAGGRGGRVVTPPDPVKISVRYQDKVREVITVDVRPVTLQFDRPPTEIKIDGDNETPIGVIATDGTNGARTRVQLTVTPHGNNGGTASATGADGNISSSSEGKDGAAGFWVKGLTPGLVDIIAKPVGAADGDPSVIRITIPVK